MFLDQSMLIKESTFPTLLLRESTLPDYPDERVKSPHSPDERVNSPECAILLYLYSKIFFLHIYIDKYVNSPHSHHERVNSPWLSCLWRPLSPLSSWESQLSTQHINTSLVNNMINIVPNPQLYDFSINICWREGQLSQLSNCESPLSQLSSWYLPLSLTLLTRESALHNILLR